MVDCRLCELVLKIVRFVVRDLCHSYNLWELSLHMLSAIDTFDLDVLLGNQTNFVRYIGLQRLSRTPSSCPLRLGVRWWRQQRAKLRDSKVQLKNF